MRAAIGPLSQTSRMELFRVPLPPQASPTLQLPQAAAAAT